jgi:hypothetical protein
VYLRVVATKSPFQEDRFSLVRGWAHARSRVRRHRRDRLGHRYAIGPHPVLRHRDQGEARSVSTAAAQVQAQAVRWTTHPKPSGSPRRCGPVSSCMATGSPVRNLRKDSSKAATGTGSFDAPNVSRPDRSPEPADSQAPRPLPFPGRSPGTGKVEARNPGNRS